MANPYMPFTGQGGGHAGGVGGAYSGNGQVSSGNMVDDHNQQFWNGANTPDSMQVNVGQASQAQRNDAQGVNSIDQTSLGYNQGLAKQYADQAAGRGPSLAQMQLQQGTDQNLKGQAALAAGGRNPGMASYQAMQNAGAATQGMAGQAAQARLAEQYQAQQGLAGVTNQMQNAYGQNAQMAQQNNQFNSSQGQQNNQFNASANNSNQQLQANINQQQNQAYNGMMAGQQQGYNQYQQQHDLNEQNSNNDARNGALGKAEDFVGGALSALSDENQKTNIGAGGGALQGFLDRLKGGGFSGGPTRGIGSETDSTMMGAGKSFAGGLQGKMGGGQGAPTGGSGGLPGANGQPGALSPGGLNGGQMPGAAPDMSGGLSQPALGSSLPGAGGAGAGLSLGGGSLAGGAAGAGGLGSLAMLSDERQKVGVKPGSAGTGSFLDKLKAHEYRYKHPDMPGAGDGQHVSVMAQELEKAGPVGQSMVKDTPNGKMVDYGKGFAAMLASQADLHHRMKRLEGSK